MQEDTENEEYEEFDDSEEDEEYEEEEKPAKRGRPTKASAPVQVPRQAPRQEARPEKKQVQQGPRFVAFHQPESIGIVDRDTNEIVGNDVYSLLAEILNKLDNLEKTV